MTGRAEPRPGGWPPPVRMCYRSLMRAYLAQVTPSALRRFLPEDLIPEDLRGDALHDDADESDFESEEVVSQRTVDAKAVPPVKPSLAPPRSTHLKPGNGNGHGKDGAANGNGGHITPTTAPTVYRRTSVAPAGAATKVEKIRIAKQKGYEGDPYPECGALTLVRSGACCKCDTCGATSGCS